MNDSHYGTGAARFYLTSQIEFRKNNTDSVEAVRPFFVTPSSIVMTTNEIGPALKASIDMLLKDAEAFENKGSDWVVDKILSAKLSICPYSANEMVVGDSGNPVDAIGRSYLKLP